MSTTNTSFSTLISAIDTKAQSLASSTTDAKDLVYLGKAIEALNIPDTVSAVIDEGDTQVAAVNSAGTTQVAAVNTEGTTQVAAIQAAAATYATITYVDTEIAGLVDSAPGTLDTLNELAAALGDDANFSTTVTNSIATKLPLAGGTMTGTLNMNSNDINNCENIYVKDKMFHNGDIDTYIGFTANNITFSAGGVTSTYNNSGLTVNSISGSYTNLHPEVTSTSAAATSQTFDMNDPMTHMTMTANTTFTATNLAAGKTSMMVLDTTASAYTPSWVSDIKWPDATQPTWADYRYWIVSFTCLNGTTTLASASGYTV